MNQAKLFILLEIVMTEGIFNVRVYGILINDRNQVLVTDEIRCGQKMTKFPGGGLQFGEGAIDCLKRECREELVRHVEVIEHFYTTDFFQRSAFNDQQQVISIYYFISIKELLDVPISKMAFDFEVEMEEAQIFRWVDLASLSESDFTFPIEKKVAGLLRKKFQTEIR